MKRLLVFTENYVRGGGNRYMVDLINGMHTEFGQVLMAANGGGVFSEDLKRCEMPVEVMRAGFFTRTLVANKTMQWPRMLQRVFLAALLPLEPILFLLNVALLRLLLARTGPALVLVCNGGYPASQACVAMLAAARLAGLPATMSIVSMPSPRRKWLAFWESVLDSVSWRCSARVIVNAHAIANALHALRGMPLERAEVVYNGLVELAAGASRDQSPTRLVVGCVARLDRLKGVLVLLEAYASLASRFPTLDLVLAGEGDASQEMRRRVAELGLHERVRFLGHFAGDVNALLAGFDIYAFPSLWEGFPYSILEAMRAGCPIVATRVGGIPEAIQDGVSGLLVQSGDEAQLAMAIAALAEDGARRQALGREARLAFGQRFSLSQMHADTRRLLKAGLNP